ncbi:MAG: ComEC/Rec2 family competence protein [Acidimicrobiales bacterium]
MPSDRAVVVLALAASAAAWSAPAPGGWVPAVAAGAVAVAFGARSRRWWLVVVGVAMVGSGLATRAWDGLGTVRAAPFTGTVTFASDPERVGPRVRVVVRHDGRRYEAWADGGTARKLALRSAGEEATVQGRTAPVSGATARRLAAVHVAGRMEIDVVADTAPGAAPARAANRIRSAVSSGVAGLPPAERALFLGLVLGDDRAQPADVVDDFRSSGLSHLTAVSGQNVAYVLASAAPVLRRLGRRSRVVAALMLLAAFALVTRFEPSVLRATAMAAVVTLTALADRRQPVLRVLALSVVVCTLLDPFLVHRVGWWLSVGATAGIAVLARPLADRLPGPRPLAEVVAVSAAAQVGVAPIQALVFDGLAVASLPANVLAAPAAAPVMGYGVPVALASLVLPEPVSTVLQLPLRLCLRWLLLVARLGAALPAGTVAGVGVAVAAVGVAVAALAPRRALRRLGVGLVAVALGVAAAQSLR